MESSYSNPYSSRNKVVGRISNPAYGKVSAMVTHSVGIPGLESCLQAVPKAGNLAAIEAFDAWT
jgi:hypothetical protein